MVIIDAMSRRVRSEVACKAAGANKVIEEWVSRKVRNQAKDIDIASDPSTRSFISWADQVHHDLDVPGGNRACAKSI
jgi:hypothetical protein